MLPRVSDNLSYLFVDIARVVQTDTGVCAETETEAGAVHRVPIPTAALACVLLGPGTSITSPALAAFMRHGTTVISAGAAGVLCYGAWQSPDRTAQWLDRQARMYADEEMRLGVATRMYEMRFGGETPEGTPLNVLRGLEGQRMRQLYKQLTAKYGLKPFKRNYDPHEWDRQSPVNQALSSANTALYGVVHSAILALGCTPGLGFVHSGKQHSFVYDIADLYKAEMTVPLAFSLHGSADPARDARFRLRKDFKLYRLMPRIVHDIQRLLDPDLDDGDDDSDASSPSRWQVVDLWDGGGANVAGGRNYAIPSVTEPLMVPDSGEV